jgi:chromosome segregation ATPase
MEEADKMHRKLVNEIEEQRKKHAELKETLENENSERLLECYQIQKELQTKIEELKAKFETEKETVRTEYGDILKRVEGEYQTKYQELYERFSQAVNNMKMDQNRFTEVMKQSEDEYDQFLEKTKENLNKTLETETNQINKLRQDNSKLQKDNDRYKDRINHLETMIADTLAQIKHMEDEERNFSDKNTMMKVYI